MSVRRGAASLIYELLIWLYPSQFRAEYEDELRRTFVAWRCDRAHGWVGEIYFWRAVLGDLVRSVPREWWSTIGLAIRRGGPFVAARPEYLGAAIAGVCTFSLYALTLAPSIGFWDSGEYSVAAHTLGIPHPPGSPLFVLLGKAWETLLQPTGLAPIVRLNMFAAVLSATTHAIWFLVVERILRGRGTGRPVRWIGAAAAVALSATAFTVWNHSNVHEKVYPISLFTTALAVWLILRWRDSGRRLRYLFTLSVILGLTATNHLMGVLVAPALLVFVLATYRRTLLVPRLWLTAIPLMALAFSVQLFLPLRAGQRPILAEGQPECPSIASAVASVYTWGGTGCEALSAVLTREQYGKPSILLDPTVYPQEQQPRSAALLAAQLVNYGQYFDWQWARGVDGSNPLFGGSRPLVTVLFVLLGLLGARTHWRLDRGSALLLGTLFLTLSVGLVLYLNFKYGYSIALAEVPNPVMHEVRERDYFFMIGFSVWGLWAGIGLSAAWSRLATSLEGAIPHSKLAVAPILGLSLLPLALNWSWASRAGDYAARDFAHNVLMSVQPYGVLVTNGDNDTFPLWYLQEVEGLRQDVTVIVRDYLNTGWYVKQLRDLTEPCEQGINPRAHPGRIVCQRPLDPADIPPALVSAGWVDSAEPPPDSIFPLSDQEIAEIASTYLVTEEPMIFRAGEVTTRLTPGTALLPADTFVATMLQATIIDRPIHFMPGSPVVSKLGLGDYTVRHGLTWRIEEGATAEDPEAGVVRLPRDEEVPFLGAAVNLPLSDALFWDVYMRRGRILDRDAPWVDAATSGIPIQYAYAHYAAAQGHALQNDDVAVERHFREAGWWERVISN